MQDFHRRGSHLGKSGPISLKGGGGGPLSYLGKSGPILLYTMELLVQGRGGGLQTPRLPQMLTRM